MARGDSEINVLEAAERCEPPMERNEVIRTVKSLATQHIATSTSPATAKPTIWATVADDAPPWPVLDNPAR